jgi:hypothetical protein
MGNPSWDLESLEDVSKALAQYIADVEKAAADMGKAAQECMDNLGGDKFSMQALEEVNICQSRLVISADTAKSLKQKVDQKIGEISDTTL